MTAAVRNLDPLPDIAEVYRVIKGEPLPEEGGDERRAYCLSKDHNDVGHPSCDYNVTKQVFHCKTCEADGNVYTLVVGAGLAEDNKGVRTWLRSKGLMPELSKLDAWARVDKVYEYTDADGAVVYEVGRWNAPKQFSQRVPDGKGGWKSGNGALKGVTRYPYNLPDLLKATGDVYVVEGEKDADRLRDLRMVATTCAQGASADWPLAWADYFKRAARVIVICDNDEAGRNAGRKRAAIIARAVPDTRLIECLPNVAEKGDVSDFLDAGGTIGQLGALIETVGPIEPYEPAYPSGALEGLLPHLSDLGNGRWFADTVGQDARFVQDVGKWLAYCDGVWTPRANTVALTEKAVQKLRSACEDYSGPRRDEVAEHVRKTEAVTARRAMLEASQAHLTRYSDEFNTNGALLNVENGTIDLETSLLLPHNREQYLTFKSPIEYDPSAVCPKFEHLLDEATATIDGTRRPHLREYVELMLGGALIARPTQRRCYFLYGPKGTRKSTIIRVLEAVLADYATSIAYRTLSDTKFEADGQSASPGIAKLRGRRLVVASEAKEHQRIDVALIKRLIGGDTIAARHLHAEEITFRFEATLILTGNDMPRIIGDDSFWQKFKPIPFENPLAVEDPQFEEREIKPELPGILALLVRAHGRLRDAGYHVDDPPEVIERCKEEREAQNPIADFIRDCVTDREDSRIEKRTLREAYKAYCTKTGAYVLGNRSLANSLKHLGWIDKKSNSSDYWISKALREIDPPY